MSAKNIQDGRESDRTLEWPSPAAADNPVNIQEIEHMILENCCVTGQDISADRKISIGSVKTIIHARLMFDKVTTRLVPKRTAIRSEYPNDHTVAPSQQLQQRERDNILNRTLTGDETWILHFTPES